MHVAAPPPLPPTHRDTADRVVGAQAEGVLQNGTERITSIVIFVLFDKESQEKPDWRT